MNYPPNDDPRMGKGKILLRYYKIKAPLIKRSRLTRRNAGGVGKDLSDGWVINFVVGCTHGCPFCYADSIIRRFARSRFGKIVLTKWGDYILVPSNLKQVISKTSWNRWAGSEILLSSMHDPYLPFIVNETREILEVALSRGVNFCIQTRSTLVKKDLELFQRFRGQIRLQISLATMDKHFAKLIEPRVPPPDSRLEVLKEASEMGIKVGVILAPIFPPTPPREDWKKDVKELLDAISEIRPNRVFGEALHRRGNNILYLERILGVKIKAHELSKFDAMAGKYFQKLLRERKLKGCWWFEKTR